MTTTQKIIKYCAIGLAIVLSISIIVGIAGVIEMIFSIGKDDSLLDSIVDIEISQDIKSLYIEIDASELKIVEGETFSLGSNIKDLKVKESNGKLSIIHNPNKVIINSKKSAEIVLTIPSNARFELVTIEAGAGDINIDKLVAKKMEFGFGAGKVNIEYIYAEYGAELEAGAGKLAIGSGYIRDLKLDLGVGDTSICANLKGHNDINCGVGKTNLTVCGDRSDYIVNVETGIGSVKLDGSTIKGSATIGDGDNEINVDGGVGSINIRFEND